MTDTSFYKWLTINSLTLLLGVYILAQWELFNEVIPISSISIFFFILLSIGTFYLGRSASRSNNPYLMTQLSMMLILFKLVCCVVIVLVYDRAYMPANNAYLIPLFLIYLTYTVFEVIMLTRANKKADEQR